jgi:hypothetical protein
MTVWVDFSVYAALIVAFWFFFAGRTSGLALQMAADRSEDWLAANRELATAVLRGRWMVGSLERAIHLALTITLVVAMVALGRISRNSQSLRSASA